MTPTLRNAVLLPRWSKGLAQESIDLIVRTGSVINAPRRTAINTFITSLKTAGIWTKLDALWVTANYDQRVSRLNWVSTSFTLSVSGTTTFTADRGFAGDAIDGHLVAASMSLAALPNAVQDSSHLSAWVIGGTDAAVTKYAVGLVGTSGSWSLRPRDASGLLSGPINSATVSNLAAQATINGDSLIARTGATAVAGYKNGAAASTSNAASTTRSASNVCLLRAGSTYADYQISIASVGAGLDGTEAAAFYNAKLAYMQAVGAV